MGRKIYDEDLRLNLILNGQGLNHGSKQMVAELGKMELGMIRLEQKANQLAAEIKVLAKDEIANATALAKARREYASTTREIRAQAVAIEKLRQQVGIAGMTVQQLKNHAKALQVQLNNMTGNPALRRALLNDLQATNIRIRTLTTGASRLSQAWERLEKAATKMGSIFGMFAMVVYSVVRVVTNVIARMKELEDLMGTVRKNTGLVAGEVWNMKEAFDAWETRTTSDDLLRLAIVAGKLGIEGKENIMKFVDSANMIQIALGDDLDGTVEDTVNSLGKLMNAFRVFEKIDPDTGKKFTIEKAMLQTGSVLNELAKSSAASAGTILTYMTRLSSVGELAGFTIAQIGGLASALDAMNIPAERGSTALQKIMMQMANPKKVKDFAEALGVTQEAYSKMLLNDPNQVLLNLMHNFIANKKGLEELVDGMHSFGTRGERMVGVIGSLAQNLDIVAAQQLIAADAWKKGTSVLEEYDIMNNNFTANVLKQQRTLKKTTDQVNKDLEPAVLNLVTAWTSFVVGVKAVSDWIGRHWQGVKVLIAAYITLNFISLIRISNMMLETAWLYKTIVLQALDVFWKKATILWTRNLSVEQIRLMGTSKLLTIANTALTQGFRAARAQMILLTATGSVMAYPLVAIAVAIAAVAGSIYWLTMRTKTLTEAEKAHIELQNSIKAGYLKESSRLDILKGRLLDVNASQKERAAGIRSLNDAYGDYLPNLLKESSSVAEIAKSWDLVMEAAARKIAFDEIEAAGIENRKKFKKNNEEIRLLEVEIAETARINKIKDITDADRDKLYEVADVLRTTQVMTELRRRNALIVAEDQKLENQRAAVAPKPHKILVNGEWKEPVDDSIFKERQADLKRNFDEEELLLKQKANKELKSDEWLGDETRKVKIKYLQDALADRRASYRTEGLDFDDYMKAQGELEDEINAGRKDDAKLNKKDKKEEVKDVKEFSQNIIDVEKLRIDTITDEREKAIAEEEERNLQSMFKHRMDDDAMEYEEQAHNRNIKEINLKFLDQQFADKKVSEANKRLILEEYHNKELIGDEQYWTSKAQLNKESAEKLAEFQQKYALYSMDEMIQIEVDEYKKSEEYALLSEEKKQKGIEEIQLKYGRARAKNQKKTIEDELNTIKEKFTNEQQITFEKGEQILSIAQKFGQGMGDSFASMFDKSQNAFAVFSKNMLLLAIEETRAYVRLQYVKMLASNVLKYNAYGVAVTAGEIALIEAAFGAAAGLVGTINTAKTKQKAEGSYPVIGADDGRLYNAVNGGMPQTGVYGVPTLLNMSDGRSLVGERAPEMVIDGETFRRLQLNAPQILRDIYAYAGRGVGGTRQMAAGSYPGGAVSGMNGVSGRDGEQSRVNDERLIAAIDRLNGHLDKGLKTSINKFGRGGISDAIDDIKNFNAKVYRK